MQTDFASLDLSPALLEVVKELGFEKLTSIQERSIPLLLEGRDLIGQSKTGSGKTAAFTLPVLSKLEKLGQNLNTSRDVTTLVLCPTRELCTQVAREIRKLGRRHPGLQVLPLGGGQPIYTQLAALENGAHIVVGTPGRILDHLRRRTLDLSQVSTLVLDEADRMLDMGFQEDMEAILSKVPSNRQTVFFSATFPKSIEAMSRDYQDNPARVTVEDSQQSTPAIRQLCFEANPDVKPGALLWLLEQNRPDAAIVFCNQKATVTELNRILQDAGVSSAAIHGDLEQHERDRVMAKFRNLSTRILIATDVAARGIDIENLDLVVNYDLPPKVDVYVHRIGRTGRAGKAGLAISLATSREGGRVAMIEEVTGFKLIRKTMASQAQLDAGANKSEAHASAKMETLYISGGRKEKVRPGDILGALTGEAGGLSAVQIGKIEIHDHFSYVAVTKQIAQMAVARLNSGRIKGRRFRVHLVR